DDGPLLMATNLLYTIHNIQYKIIAHNHSIIPLRDVFNLFMFILGADGITFYSNINRYLRVSTKKNNIRTKKTRKKHILFGVSPLDDISQYIGPIFSLYRLKGKSLLVPLTTVKMSGFVFGGSMEGLECAIFFPNASHFNNT
ncbi:hypothetical protein ACJX0J_030360, partial [Zea mays]